MSYRRNPRPLRLLLLLAGAVFLAAACGGGGEDSPTGLTSLTVAEVELVSFDLVNAARQNNSIDALNGPDNLVATVARAHSESMRDEGFFGHEGSHGGLRARLREAGVPFRTAGENLAKVASAGDPAAAAHSRFLSSSEHRDVMLDARFELAGVGVARNGDTYWLTQIYIER